MKLIGFTGERWSLSVNDGDKGDGLLNPDTPDEIGPPAYQGISNWTSPGISKPKLQDLKLDLVGGGQS